MKKIFLSNDLELLDEWKQRENKSAIICDDIETLEPHLALKDALLVVDYDSMASYISKAISSNTLYPYTIVLEKKPEVVSGLMLIKNGVKAYANSRMLTLHYNSMIESVENEKVWTYPQLTVALVELSSTPLVKEEAKEMLKNRLSEKEIEVVYLILRGLTNDAIAEELSISTRTVKAHISSIFSKLHITDRVSLFILLKN